MDLLDLLAEIEGADEPGADTVHAMLPNMWFACGGTPVRNCRCGKCDGCYRPGRWEYRYKSTKGVTCLECLDALADLARTPPSWWK